MVVHFDTINGRAPHVDKLKVKRNCTYALVLDQNGKELGRLEKPTGLTSVIKLLRMHVTPALTSLTLLAPAQAQ